MNRNYFPTLKYNIATVLLLLMLSSCANNNEQLESAPRLAGNNRAELEKVLSHYTQNPTDSLKLKAAQFLIENMPGHYSYGNNGINEYYAEIDSVLTNTSMALSEKMIAVEQATAKYPRLDANIVEDVTIIKADLLINNIERAFVTKTQLVFYAQLRWEYNKSKKYLL